MLTHLVHFHIPGASPSAVAATAECGWAQGHFLGPYLGSGVGSSVTLDGFEGGWAQGSFLAYYYGAGVDSSAIVIEAETPGGGGGFAKRVKHSAAYYQLQSQIRREDEEIITIFTAAVKLGLI